MILLSSFEARLELESDAALVPCQQEGPLFRELRERPVESQSSEKGEGEEVSNRVRRDKKPG